VGPTDGQRLIDGPQGRRGLLGSEGREGNGSRPLPHVGWAGAVKLAVKERSFLFFFQRIFQIHRVK
jgi:hypothetical protein